MPSKARWTDSRIASYKLLESPETKVCRGHFCQGDKRPLTDFYIHKSGARKGRPFSQCIRCWHWQRAHPKNETGWVTMVPKRLAMPVFRELFRRLGPQETARRVGVAYNQLSPSRLRRKRSFRLQTYERAKDVLEKARQNGEDNWDVVAFKTSLLNPTVGGLARQKARRQWEYDFEERRHVKIRGPLGFPLYVTNRYTWEEATKIWRSQVKIPLDLVPPEYWRAPGAEFHRFSEEMLGDDF